MPSSKIVTTTSFPVYPFFQAPTMFMSDWQLCMLSLQCCQQTKWKISTWVDKRKTGYIKYSFHTKKKKKKSKLMLHGIFCFVLFFLKCQIWTFIYFSKGWMYCKDRKGIQYVLRKMTNSTCIKFLITLLCEALLPSLPDLRK